MVWLLILPDFNSHKSGAHLASSKKHWKFYVLFLCWKTFWLPEVLIDFTFEKHFPFCTFFYDLVFNPGDICNANAIFKFQFNVLIVNKLSSSARASAKALKSVMKGYIVHNNVRHRLQSHHSTQQNQLMKIILFGVYVQVTFHQEYLQNSFHVSTRGIE